jgi:hypothetical protein
VITKVIDYIESLKHIINNVLLAFGIGLTFLGDFKTYANSFVTSNVGQLLFMDISNISVDNMEKVDIAISMFMRVVVGTGSLLILWYAKKNKKDE